MAASTPRKTCVLSDVCILCGFSFIQIEKTDGGEKIHKFFDIKLKLNKERVDNVKKITGLPDIDVATNAGVCKKCYRSVESILKTEEKKPDNQAEIPRNCRNHNEITHATTALTKEKIYK